MKEISHPKVNPYEQIRKLPRKKGYDYTRTGTYFATFCTDSRVCYLGDIVDGKMKYSHQGCVARVILKILPKLFPKVEMLNFVIMPDHIHILLSIFNEEADLRAFEHRNDIETEKKRYAKHSLSSLIGSFKSAITRECHEMGYKMKWQSSFFDRVVRNSRELGKIDRYVNENPIRWNIDKHRDDIWM